MAESKKTILQKLIAIKKAILVIKQKILELLLKKEKSEKEVRRITIRELAEAMARFEGWNVPNSLCRRNNNPCNLRWSKYQTAVRDGFAFFSNEETGWKACIWDLCCKREGRTRTGLGPESTIEQLIRVWSVTDQENYIKYVCRQLKVEPNYKLKNFIC